MQFLPSVLAPIQKNACERVVKGIFESRGRCTFVVFPLVFSDIPKSGFSKIWLG